MPHAKRQQGLLVVCGAMFISAVDMTIVNVALPDISEDLNAGIGELQWVLDAFLVALAGLLLLGSGLADRFGRKRVFLAGMAGFARRLVPLRDRALAGRADRRARADGRGGRVRAAACPVADRGHVPAGGATAGARRVGGGRRRRAGARSAARRRARQRGRVGGGLPGERAGRDPGRAVPAGRCCPSRRGRAPRRWTWSGSCYRSSLGCIVFALIEGPDPGWSSPEVLITGPIGLAAAIAFVRAELRRRNPLFDVRVLARPAVAAGAVAILSVYIASSGRCSCCPSTCSTCRTAR